MQVFKDIEPDVCTTLADSLRAASFDSIDEEDRPNTVFFAKLSHLGASATTTIYESGTILVQGKALWLVDRLCTLIEKEANLPMALVACRLLCDVTEAEKVLKLVTDEVQTGAHEKCCEALGDALTFLSAYDQKYALTTFALLQLNISMPEYSYIVMPLAKCYEGYFIKLLISLSLTTLADVQTKDWNFGNVWNQDLKSFYAIGKDHKVYLDRLKVQLPFCRHFYQHSDSTGLHEVKTFEIGRDHVEKIRREIKETYECFSSFPESNL